MKCWLLAAVSRSVHPHQIFIHSFLQFTGKIEIENVWLDVSVYPCWPVFSCGGWVTVEGTGEIRDAPIHRYWLTSISVQITVSSNETVFTSTRDRLEVMSYSFLHFKDPLWLSMLCFFYVFIFYANDFFLSLTDTYWYGHQHRPRVSILLYPDRKYRRNSNTVHIAKHFKTL